MDNNEKDAQILPESLGCIEADNEQYSFFLLKSEAYLFRRADFIKREVEARGFKIIETWKVRMKFSDIFKIYEGFAPRVATTLRFPPLFELDVCFVKNGVKRDVIDALCELKREIRKELWGLSWLKGGFLHSPDCPEELRKHSQILEKRIVSSNRRSSFLPHRQIQ